jgi:hypothetical protein
LPLGRMEDNGLKGGPYGESSSSGEVILVANVAGTAFCTCFHALMRLCTAFCTWIHAHIFRPYTALCTWIHALAHLCSALCTWVHALIHQCTAFFTWIQPAMCSYTHMSWAPSRGLTLWLRGLRGE